MKKVRWILLIFLALNCKAGGVLEIHDEHDVIRVKNNINQFWEKHTDLIPYLKEKDRLPFTQLASIENDKTWVTRDYKISRSVFKKELKETIRYVTNHFTEIEKSLGREDALDFQQKLNALTYLINKLPRKS